MDNRNQLTIEVLLRPSDVYGSVFWTRGNIFRLLLLFLACLFLYDTLVGRASMGHDEFLSTLAWIVVFFVCAGLGLFLVPYLRTVFMFRTSPALKLTRRITFSDTGIHFESTDSVGDHKWSLFAGVVETRKTFLLKQTAYAATYIPKRCFSSPEEIQLVRDLIRQNFKGKYKLRGIAN